MQTLGDRLGSILIGLATALVIVAVTIPLFLNPFWVGFEQGRSEAAAWTGYPEPVLRDVTNAILVDLVVGPPDFDVAVAGVPVLDERERSHMRDVRGVFIGFFVLTAAVAIGGAIVGAARRRSPAGRAANWSAVRGGSIALIAALVLGGVVSLVAFDALFETFHQLFFPGGSYDFDPATAKLVQLFPFAFWDETALVLGVVAIVIAAVVAAVAHRRLGRARRELVDPTTVGTMAPGTDASTAG